MGKVCTIGGGSLVNIGVCILQVCRAWVLCVHVIFAGVENTGNDGQ